MYKPKGSGLMNIIKYGMNVVCVAHIITMVAMDKPHNKMAIDLSSANVPPLYAPKLAYDKFEDLVKNDAAFLKSLVAIELNGRHSLDLDVAEGVLRTGLASKEGKQFEEESKAHVIHFVHTIAQKATLCKDVLNAIENSTKKINKLKSIHINKYVANSHSHRDFIGKMTPLLHILYKAKGDPSYLPLSLKHMRLLLQAGANPNAVNAKGTLFEHVVSVEQAMLLCEFGGNINCLNSAYETPLMRHVGSKNNKSNKDIVAFLLENGALVNLQDGKGNTVLHRVVADDNRGSMVELLMFHGANYELRNDKNQAAIQLAQASTRKIFADRLHLSLVHALKNNDVSSVENLMKYQWLSYAINGVNIISWAKKNCLQAENDKFVLMKSVQVFEALLIDRLCNAGANESTRLIKEGANVNTRGTESDNLPLLYAVLKKQTVEKVKVLLENGARTSDTIMKAASQDTCSPEIRTLIKEEHESCCICFEFTEDRSQVHVHDEFICGTCLARLIICPICRENL